MRIDCRKLWLVALLLAAAGAHAEQDSSWLNSTIATCEQEYDKTRCQDPGFLEQHYHVASLQIAHDTARRRHEQERAALRELTLQRVCDDPQEACAESDSTCVAQTEQACAALKQQAAQCLAQVETFCAQNPSAQCVAMRSVRCPSAKEQKIDDLLRKYPLLTATQKAHLRNVAQQLDANNRSVIGSLFQWLGL